MITRVQLMDTKEISIGDGFYIEISPHNTSEFQFEISLCYEKGSFDADLLGDKLGKFYKLINKFVDDNRFYKLDNYEVVPTHFIFGLKGDVLSSLINEVIG